jgi:hypothetical protein
MCPHYCARVGITGFQQAICDQDIRLQCVDCIVLMQEGHPIVYLSQSLNCTNQGCPAYEKECLAILLAVNKWRSYLQHKEFIIRTDQKSLTQLGEQQLTMGIQHKAFVKLMGLQYSIQYKKGPSNIAADAMTSHP